MAQAVRRQEQQRDAARAARGGAGAPRDAASIGAVRRLADQTLAAQLVLQRARVRRNVNLTTNSQLFFFNFFKIQLKKSYR